MIDYKAVAQTKNFIVLDKYTKIELRVKQYEHYRDQLLSFPKPDQKEQK